MQHDNKIRLKKDQKQKIISEIKAFFIDNREEEIGDLQAEMLCDLLIEKVGGEIYNKGLYDAKAWFESYWQDKEADFYNMEKK